MLYPEKTRKRMEITRDVIAQNGINEYVFTPESSTLFSQAFELIQFGAYVNFYLAMLYGQDPAPITWVDYFKEQLAK